MGAGGTNGGLGILRGGIDGNIELGLDGDGCRAECSDQIHLRDVGDLGGFILSVVAINEPIVSGLATTNEAEI